MCAIQDFGGVMRKHLALLMAAVGVLLIVVAVTYSNIAEVRQWFPVALIVGGALAWTGLRRYQAA
jgi:drug/metabolite transporter (DMT)-like permease